MQNSCLCTCCTKHQYVWSLHACITSALSFSLPCCRRSSGSRELLAWQSPARRLSSPTRACWMARCCCPTPWRPSTQQQCLVLPTDRRRPPSPSLHHAPLFTQLRGQCRQTSMPAAAAQRIFRHAPSPRRLRGMRDRRPCAI
jgi:hypothetical protein